MLVLAVFLAKAGPAAHHALQRIAGKFGQSAAIGLVPVPKAQMVAKQAWTYASTPGALLLPRCTRDLDKAAHRSALVQCSHHVCKMCHHRALCRPDCSIGTRSRKRHHMPAVLSQRPEHADTWGR
jgi:hypothetical protein